MQELNHDMDDLFRRAAESYPLQQTADWDNIVKKLDVSLPHVSKQKSYKKRWLLLLMFFFLVTGSYIAIDRFPGDSNQSSPDPHPDAGRQATVHSHHETAADEKPTSDEKHVVRREQLALETPGDESSHQRSGDVQKSPDTRQAPLSNGFSNVQFEAKPNTAPIKRKGQKAIRWQGYPTQKQVLSGDQHNTTNNYPDHNEPTPIKTLESLVHPYPNEKITVPQTELKINSLGKVAITIAPQPQKQNFKTKPTLYFGITGGLAFNSVKSYDYNRAFKGGLFAGVQFSNRFSAETGLLYTLNNYEAKSMHFDKTGIEGMLTGGRQLDEVHGSNKLVEIPLSIRYKFSQRPKSFYASGGISSYIMTRETNWYLTTLNGANEMLYGDYNKKNVYIASALTISAGYQLPAGQKNSIRLEPYVQLPLKGIGVGKIRLMSAGIRVGFSRTTQ